MAVDDPHESMDETQDKLDEKQQKPGEILDELEGTEGEQGEPDETQDKLDEFLAQMETTYREESKEYQRCIKIVAEDLKHVLAQEFIRHIHIASRVKSWGSIRISARRQQTERLKAKKLMEKMEKMKSIDENWTSIFNRYKMSLTEVGYFKTREELEQAFSDILGARIALYFPYDKKAVVYLLEGAGYKKANEWKQMGGLSNAKRQRKFYEKLLHEFISEKRIDNLDLDGLEQQFSGYGALHIVMKIPKRLQPRNLRRYKRKIWEKMVVEIQVATVVMHAWAEVEHDIIYKSGERKPTQEEKALLDMLNGLAIASEVGLRRIQSRQPNNGKTSSETDKTPSPSPVAETMKELKSWLYQSCIPEDRRQPTEWIDLKLLWEILVTDRQNRWDVVQPLIKSAWVKLREFERKGKKGFELDRFLPRIMLDILCEEEQPTDVSAQGDGVDEAWAPAFQLVNSLNLAQNIEFGEDLSKHYNEVLAKPYSPTASMLDFLDILHPLVPQFPPGRKKEIARFCYALLKSDPTSLKRPDRLWHNGKRYSKKDKEWETLWEIQRKLTIRLSIRLAQRGYTAFPKLGNPEELRKPLYTIALPGSLSKLWVDSKIVQKQGEEQALKQGKSLEDSEKAGTKIYHKYEYIKSAKYFLPAHKGNTSGLERWIVMVESIWSWKICQVSKLSPVVTAINTGKEGERLGYGTTGIQLAAEIARRIHYSSYRRFAERNPFARQVASRWTADGRGRDDKAASDRSTDAKEPQAQPPADRAESEPDEPAVAAQPSVPIQPSAVPSHQSS